VAPSSGATMPTMREHTTKKARAYTNTFAKMAMRQGG